MTDNDCPWAGRYRFFEISEREHAPEIVAHERAIRRTMIASSR